MKKIIGIPRLSFLLFISVFSLFVTLNINYVSVIAGGKPSIIKYRQNGENLNIAFTGIKAPEEKKTKVFIGDQSFSVDDIKNSSDYKEGISYIFVVDVSGSVQTAQYQLMEEIMGALVKKSNTGNIKIFIVGDKVIPFDTASGSNDDMVDKIRTIRDRAVEAGVYQTSLYDGIVTALKESEKDNEINLVSAMVVFSDGFEEKRDGRTIGEVEDAIKESRIPVYTVPVAPGVDIGGGQDTNEILSSFARLSNGGEAISSSDVFDVNSVAKKIDESVGKINIANISLKQLKSGNDTRDLKLEYAGESDRVELDISDLDFSNIASSDDNGGVKADSVDVASNKKSLPLVPIVIGVSVLAVGGIAFIFIQSMNSGKFTLVFDMGNRNVKKVMKDKFIIGRDDVKSHFAMPGDNMLSSMHCMIYTNNKNLYIKDLDSTNGTYLNGKKVTGSSPLSKGDILLIGSIEMKISWE